MSGNWVDTMEGRQYNRLQEIFRKRRKARAHEAGMNALCSRFEYPEAVQKIVADMKVGQVVPYFKRSLWSRIKFWFILKMAAWAAWRAK